MWPSVPKLGPSLAKHRPTLVKFHSIRSEIGPRGLKSSARRMATARRTPPHAMPKQFRNSRPTDGAAETNLTSHFCVVFAPPAARSESTFLGCAKGCNSRGSVGDVGYGERSWPAKRLINRKLPPKWALKARSWAMLHFSGAAVCREADVRGQDPIRRAGSQPRTSATRPKPAPEKRNIVQLRLHPGRTQL